MQKPKFSFSQIDLYKRCPKAYYFQYVKKIPQKFSIYAYFWSVIHNTLQKFFEWKKEKFESPMLFWDFFDEEKEFSDDSLENLLKIFSEKFNWENFWDEAENFYERWKKILENFYQNENIWDWVLPFFIEKRFQIDFWDFVINWRFDRVDKIWENKFEIIDYKTWKLRNENDVKNDLQLWLYCIAMKNLWFEPKKAYLYFLDHWEKFYFEINDENLKKSKNETKQFFENLKKEKFWALPEENKCKYCSFKKYCEFKK